MKGNVIVTGASGFIGKHLVELLLKKGYEVFALSSCTPAVKNIEKLHCLQLSYQDWKVDMPDIHYDAFFHLGWAGVDNKEKNNKEVQISNISSSVKALDLAYTLNVDKFIGAGTVAEYALQEDLIDYKIKQAPNDVYGACKTSCHYILEAIARQRNQNFIWAIIPSSFGPGRSSDNILTYTIETLLKGESPKFGKLEQIWDFLYISEVVRALVLIMEKGLPNCVYGIGSGEFHSLRYYIDVIHSIIDSSIPLGIGEIKESKAAISSCVNIFKLKKDTGFEPNVTFEEGIKRTLEYYEKQGKIL